MTRHTHTEQQSGPAKQPPSGAHLAEGKDAIELLSEEHKKVRNMFQQYKTLKEQEDATSSEAKRQLVEECCNALTVHAQIEEEIFYPAVREAIHDDDMMDEAIVEHASAKQFIAQLGRMQPDDDLYDAMVTVLGEYVNHHIEEEEKEMFKKARQSKVDLHMLADALAQRRSQLREQMMASPKRSPKSKSLH